MIYEAREDSILLGKFLVRCKGKVLDMGCGSGYLSKILVDNKCKITGVDINEEAVNYCKKLKGNFFFSDLFSNINERFDWIIFNPPYLPKDGEEDEESRAITTDNGIIARFFMEVKNYLKENGKILIIVSSLTENFEDILKKNDFKFEIIGREKLFMEELRVYEIMPKLL